MVLYFFKIRLATFKGDRLPTSRATRQGHTITEGGDGLYFSGRYLLQDPLLYQSAEGIQMQRKGCFHNQPRNAVPRHSFPGITSAVTKDRLAPTALR